MRKPAMILFDYGNTLLHEPGIDFLRGEEEVFRHLTANPRQVTVQEAYAFGVRLFRDADSCRRNGWELHEYQLLQLKYDSLGLSFDVPLPEIERILWTATSPGEKMPGVEAMLSDLWARGIRTGVISNIGWSGQALAERINRLLPENHFEFIVASSEYGVRKPNPLLLSLALTKAGLNPCDVWYCGDSISADVCGAQAAGMFPVFYESAEVENPFAHKNARQIIEGEHLHIRRWRELAQVLNTL